MNYIENKTFAEISVGDSAQLSRVLTWRDIQLFAVMSGDVNPAHVDAEFAKNDRFHQIIAHGMWGGALISTVLGTQLPGPGTIYLNQTLHFKAPVAVGDALIVKVLVSEKHEDKKILVLQCSCINQMGVEVINGESVVIAPIEKIKRPRVELPSVELHENGGGLWYKQLMLAKDGLKPLLTAIVHPADVGSLGGAVDAAKAGLIIPVFVGCEAKIRECAAENNIDISGYKIIPTEHSHAAAEKAVSMASSGEVEALMKGKLHTQELMEAVVSRTGGLRTNRRMSHVFAMDVPVYYKPLFITDAAINIKPSLTDKRDIVQNAIDLFLSLGMGTPKVAIVSAVETVDEKIPSTLDATALCKMSERGQITGGLLDGPLAFDNAVSKEAAAAKNIIS